MRSTLIVLAALVIASSSADAQLSGPSIGGGVGVTGSGGATGKGYHGAVSVAVKSFPRNAELRTELMYQAGTATSSPFHCERVAQFYCIGRSDDNRIAAAAVFVRLKTRWIGMWRFYADPIGAGLYHRRTRSAELQGPTAICIDGDEIVSCPNNPDWATFRYQDSRMSVGANQGAGFEFQLSRVRLFAEARVHILFESGKRSAGAVPVTFGVSF
jgi:hypothetical protein